MSDDDSEDFPEIESDFESDRDDVDVGLVQNQIGLK